MDNSESDKWGSYRCGKCGGEFNRLRDPQEAMEEALAQFGAIEGDPVEICDDCYRDFMAWDQENSRNQ